MCDYSLHAIASRPAVAGETVISTSFPKTSTRGFASECERGVAVCLLPGTELAFDQVVKYSRSWIWPKNSGSCFAKFCKIPSGSHEHHDALEFPDGSVVLLTLLIAGQRARVIQLPVTEKIVKRANSRLVEPLLALDLTGETDLYAARSAFGRSAQRSSVS